ncbi:3' exoribonuclease [Ascosphaera apis ARSEF 7405]|uniref:Ribosomal RNA-processing protein 42 n=1 Tax=Ascosphaera apis ARSEF 7405 TaxID=392613 RepID=A0A162ILH8_9EURO|nr:3' exoribonuclease [Ascosphaera apis ARSEF 7405]
MPPHSIPLLSPAELAYLYTSLASYPHNPIRSDGRSATQFRSLSAETGILPGANGSARIGFADGTQAIVGVKAEVERTVKEGVVDWGAEEEDSQDQDESDVDVAGAGQERRKKRRRCGESSWVEMSIEIPGVRDDDSLPVYLAEMMRETIVSAENGTAGVGGSGAGSAEAASVDTPRSLRERLVINGGWHWRLYIDILLLSPPLSYPLPLLSLTTHLALLSTKLPRLISKDEEDPMFDDDWAAAEWLYPRPASTTTTSKLRSKQSIPFRPPVTLLVVSVGENVIFDPTQDEISVADAVFAISVVSDTSLPTTGQGQEQERAPLKLISIRTIDPPARMTNHGVLNSENPAFPNVSQGGEEKGTLALGTGAGVTVMKSEESKAVVDGVWKPRTGGVKRGVISRIVKMVVKKGGVGEEVLRGLEMVDVE